MEELKINIPKGQEIDWQESAKQKKIVFTQKVFKPKSWEEYCDSTKSAGYYIDINSEIEDIEDTGNHLDYNDDRNLLPTQELAESFLAMMQLMSLRQAWVGDWKPNWKTISNSKYSVVFIEDTLTVTDVYSISKPLTFPTREMAENFVLCFNDLIHKAKILILK